MKVSIYPVFNCYFTPTLKRRSSVYFSRMIQKRMKRGNCLLSSSVSLCLFPAINHSPLVSFFLFSSPSSPSFQWQEKRERERMNISPFVQRWRLSLHSLFSRTSSAPSSVQLLCLHPTLHYFFSCLFSLSLHTLLFNTLVLFLFTLVSFPLSFSR